ncbi:MAG: hypothetical protein RSC00_01415 [Ruthenibacterium sp.]
MMKRLFSLFLTAVLALSLTACGSGGDASGANGTPMVDAAAAMGAGSKPR